MSATGTKRRSSEAPLPDPEDAKKGLVALLIAFLDRNLGKFSPRTRDAIGLMVVFVLAGYVLNGSMGPTYIRGQIWVDKEHAGGWRVLHDDNDAITNENGYWTLPLAKNGVPGRIRIEVEDGGVTPDGSRRKRKHIGMFQAFGPVPVWNTFKPMDDYIVEVDSTAGTLRLVESKSPFVPSVPSVYAQSDQRQMQTMSAQRQMKMKTIPAACALAIDRIAMRNLPNWYRFSGRASFEIYLNGKRVSDDALLYGPYVGTEGGKFPVRSSKELWLPVRAKSSDSYKGLLANLAPLADCVTDANGYPAVRPRGSAALRMVLDNGDIIGDYDLKPALYAPNQPVELSDRGRNNAIVTVTVISSPRP